MKLYYTQRRPSKYLTKAAEEGVVEAINFKLEEESAVINAQLWYMLRKITLSLHSDGVSSTPETFPDM